MEQLQNELIQALERLQELEEKLTERGNVVAIYDSIDSAKSDLEYIRKIIDEIPKIKGEKGEDGVNGNDGKDGKNGKDATVDYSLVENRIKDIVSLIKLPTVDFLSEYTKLIKDKKIRLRDFPDYYQIATAGGGSQLISFLSLTDTPNTYAGQAGKLVTVKPTEDGLEFSNQVPQTYNLVTISTNYAVTNTNDYIEVNASGGNVTITLPNPTTLSNIRAPFWVKKIDSSLNTVTVQSASGTIDGAATQVIQFQYNLFGFFRSGSNYLVI